MMIVNYAYKALLKITNIFYCDFSKMKCYCLFLSNNVSYNTFKTIGSPYVMVARSGKFIIGNGFSMNNGIKGNPIGCYDKCTFFVDRGAMLIIGNNVGISQSALICHKSISIGSNVKIGGGVKIYDTDFHSLDTRIRVSKEDILNKVTAPVLVKDNVFIGAFSIILKGVTIGENSIIGAGSIVSKNIPDNQIWAGNPAKFIREI